MFLVKPLFLLLPKVKCVYYMYAVVATTELVAVPRAPEVVAGSVNHFLGGYV